MPNKREAPKRVEKQDEDTPSAKRQRKPVPLADSSASTSSSNKRQVASAIDRADSVKRQRKQVVPAGSDTNPPSKELPDESLVQLVGCEDLGFELGNVKWLLKSEPHVISIDDMAAKPGVEVWDGIRNFEARNLLRTVKVGDLAFFYHSSCKKPGIVGIVRFESEAYPEPGCPDVDKRGNPRWYVADVRYVKKLDRPILLDEIKQISALNDMVLIKRSRLSVQPVQPHEVLYLFQTFICCSK